MNLQEKFIKLRESVAAGVKKSGGELPTLDSLKEILAPAMNKHGVNLEVVREKAAKYEIDPNLNAWAYVSHLTFQWTNAENPDDVLEATLCAVGTSKGTPDKARDVAWERCLAKYLYTKFLLPQRKEQQTDGKSNAAEATTSPTEPRNDTGRRNTQPKTENGGNGHTEAQRQVTENQISYMYSKGNAFGIPKERINEMIYRRYGLNKPANMTLEQYTAICTEMENYGCMTSKGDKR